MKLLCSFIVCIIIFDGCLASFSRRTRSHDQSGRRERSHDQSGRRERSHGHILHHTMVKMPSGTMESITKPYKCSHFKCGDHAKRILLNRHGKMTKQEYFAVKRELMAGATTDVQYKISKIEKIINPCLWSKYWYRKQQVRVEANETKEMMLFHTSSANRLITDLGFDERYAKMGPYGAGLYFSVNSTKEHEYSKPIPDGTRTMLLCRVALGKSFETTSTQLAHAPVGYQSVKGQGTEDYVIYRGEQAYPEYLITYTI